MNGPAPLGRDMSIGYQSHTDTSVRLYLVETMAFRVLTPEAAVGKGGLNWAATFAAARTGGVRNFFVEQNMEMTRESVVALKAMKA